MKVKNESGARFRATESNQLLAGHIWRWHVGLSSKGTGAEIGCL